MKTFKVCGDCIKDLRILRWDLESKSSEFIRPAQRTTTLCQNMPRCFDQPERSKREEVCSCMKIPHVAADCWNTGCGKEHIMRCSEHCGNTVRDK